MTVQSLIDENDDLINKFENSLNKLEGVYDNIGYIWIEANKIKNLNLKINKFPSILTKWEEIKELNDFIK